MELKGGWKQLCKETLAQLLQDKRVWAFTQPVDAKALQLHDYTKIVTKPMDLSAVSRKLDNGTYKHLARLSGQEFYKDVILTFDNALLFNIKGDEIWEHAYSLKETFQALWAKALERAGRADRGKDASAGRGCGDSKSSESGIESSSQSVLQILACQKCLKVFKTMQARNGHKRSCKDEILKSIACAAKVSAARSNKVVYRGAEPKTHAVSKAFGISSTVRLEKHVQLCKNPPSMLAVDMLDQVLA